jgi:hypothetical protein
MGALEREKRRDKEGRQETRSHTTTSSVCNNDATKQSTNLMGYRDTKKSREQPNINLENAKYHTADQLESMLQ